jgi:hypothetical protein
MSTIISAHFDGEHFVPDEPVVGIAPGEHVQVVAVAKPAPTAEPAKNFWQWLVDNPIPDDGLPADLGYQHDHYLYGTPKVPD